MDEDMVQLMLLLNEGTDAEVASFLRGLPSAYLIDLTDMVDRISRALWNERAKQVRKVS